MGGHLLMSRKELKRKSVLELAQNKHITLQEASRRMKLGYRQTLRVYARFCSEGDSGLLHRNRGKRSNRAYPADFRQKVVSRYRKRYKKHDLGPTLAAEKLAGDGLEVDHETLRRWLLEDGDWQKQRKRKIHRTRRQRRSHFGELVQMDGSHHNWFGSDHGKKCLMNMVDDATGRTMGLMDNQETTEAAMRLLWRWVDKYGIPLALYTDKKNVYLSTRKPTVEELLAEEEPKRPSAEPVRSWISKLSRLIRPKPKAGWSAPTARTRIGSLKNWLCAASQPASRPTNCSRTDFVRT